MKLSLDFEDWIFCYVSRVTSRSRLARHID